MNGAFEGKSLVELLDMLEPVPEPQPVSMVPQTAGWLVLGLFGLAVTCWLLWIALRRYRANGYRRAALRALQAAGDDPAQLATLLRRTALAAYPRSQVAGLHGEDWAGFLNKTYGQSGFATDVGRALLSAPFRQQPPDPAATQLVRNWIIGHRRDGGRRPC